MADNRTTVEQFLRAMGTGDFEAQERLLTSDFIEVYPQSGEVIRGNDNRRAIMENYPGGTPKDATQLNATAPELRGSGDQFTAHGQVTYPNGETWDVVSLIDLRDGKISKVTSYFAAPFEAPAWRAPYVEKETAEARSR